ncbi:MAG: heavy metal-associated domain-containing protein [Candidatus Borkfalkiaceae bacterium]|jgi:copper chaperone CopZ|nr:heavy metal-associated domain-containing protein [Eubacteriales bacterium]MDY5820201.1 heavy metal-associated domain-containing protein [Christensenellaceae bacterium]CDE21155.1 heavy metal transport/detoxification protein [Acidiphilium sp. CAG:727]
MKKVVRIKNLDCANCAAALERAVAKIDGVNSVNVSFIGEKMTLDYDENKNVLDEIKTAAKKLEPDWEFIGL